MPGNYPTPLQRQRLREIEAAGGVGAVVRSVEDVVKVLAPETISSGYGLSEAALRQIHEAPPLLEALQASLRWLSLEHLLLLKDAIAEDQERRQQEEATV